MSRVLLVEDDDDIREAYAVALEDEGHEVLQAANGEEALALLEGGERADLVLIDLLMPVMNGWELIERLRAHPRWSMLPVIVVSATAAGELRRLPVDRVLSKPISIEVLLDAVARTAREVPAYAGANTR